MLRFLLSMGLLTCISVANSATFTVTSTDDSGPGTLRDAIAQANALAGPDTIAFAPSVQGTILLTTGQIRIGTTLTIAGPGADKLTIDGNANGRIFSIFANDPACPLFDGPDFHVSISDLTLANARRTTSASGGAIFTEHTLSLNSVVIRDNRATLGAGIAFAVQYPQQTLTIANSQFVDNIAMPLATGAVEAQGGAVRIFERCDGRTNPVPVFISDSVFSGNRAQPTTGNGFGGAIAAFAIGAGIEITNTRIVDNHIDVPSPPVAGRSYLGGGMMSTGRSLTIDRSEISANSAGSVVADNTGGIGGGLEIYSDAPDLQTTGTALDFLVVNSTISSNVANQTGGAMNIYGNVDVQLFNSTIVNNAANVSNARTGGIRVDAGITNPASPGVVTRAPTLFLRSTILANNTGADIGGFPNANLPSPFVVDADNSIVRSPCGGNVSVCTVVGDFNLLGVDPAPGPLTFNGGATRTHALPAGSPAQNGGSNLLAVLTDQRGAGYPRTSSGGATDIGAFQSGGPSAYSNQWVQKSYVAYYGRPSDPLGLAYWARRMDQEGGSLSSIIGAFGMSDEFTRRYGGLTFSQLLDSLYQQTLGRLPDPAGKQYYLDQLTMGHTTLQTITLDLLGGATGLDALTVANRLNVADHYVQKVAAGCAYGSEQVGVDALSTVTSDESTVSAAKAAIDERCGP